MKNKEEIRKEGLGQRAQMPDEAVKERSREIQEKVLEILHREDTIMTYLSYRNEVGTDFLMKELLQQTKQVLAVPKISEDKIIACRIENTEDLKKNKLGIREPKEVEEVSKKSIDACIVPGVRFDKEGNRIGYGKGYYDRFLEDFQGRKVGLTYEKLVEEKIPNNEWDVQMDKIITENNVYREFS